jgi:hypothetical protein
MGAVVSYLDHKRRAKGGRAPHADAVIAEILESLLALGGSAHRQEVADLIVRRLKGRPDPATRVARSEIYAAFDAYLSWAATRKSPPLLHCPLGAGSYRWALTAAGSRLFRATMPAARMVR